MVTFRYKARELFYVDSAIPGYWCLGGGLVVVARGANGDGGESEAEQGKREEHQDNTSSEETVEPKAEGSQNEVIASASSSSEPVPYSDDNSFHDWSGVFMCLSMMAFALFLMGLFLIGRLYHRMKIAYEQLSVHFASQVEKIHQTLVELSDCGNRHAFDLENLQKHILLRLASIESSLKVEQKERQVDEAAQPSRKLEMLSDSMGNYDDWKRKIEPKDFFEFSLSEKRSLPQGPKLLFSHALVEMEDNTKVSYSPLVLADLFRTFAEQVEKKHPGTRHLLLRPEELQNRVFWVLGDIHGAARELELSLEWVRSHMDEQHKHTVVFLGDMIDRASLEMHVKVFNSIATLYESGVEVIYLCGNHDEALSYNESTGQFESHVVPSEFVTQLNETPRLHDLGHSLIRFFSTCPVSLCVQYGTTGEAVMMSHAGVPHDDVLKQWYESTSPDDSYPDGRVACSPHWIHDCIWARLTGQMLKNPSRGIAGHELGRLNLRYFCSLLAERAGLRLSYFIHGHEHPVKGYHVDEDNDQIVGCRVLTICNMAPEGSLYTANRTPSLVHWDVAANRLSVVSIATPAHA